MNPNKHAIAVETANAMLAKADEARAAGLISQDVRDDLITLLAENSALFALAGATLGQAGCSVYMGAMRDLVAAGEKLLAEQFRQ